MSPQAALAALLPVLAFLAVLVAVDSGKLVKTRTVAGVVGAGALMALASYLLHDAVLAWSGIDYRAYARLGAPLVEECLKAAVVVGLVRARRIGFVVDAAMLGFGVGTGFALVENLYYLHRLPDAHLGLWLVRGFGTAIMHGGASALFAVTAVSRLDRRRGGRWAAYLSGLGIAVAVHAAFNLGLPSPTWAAAGMMLLVPVLLAWAFIRGEAAVARWLGRGFDADAEMLELIHSGHLSDTPVGRYLETLRTRFAGPVVADLLCYLRLYTELALRAKGVLIMREHGFAPPAIDAGVRERFAELRYLERSIGATGLRALRPLLHLHRKEFWQLHMLEAGR